LLTDYILHPYRLAEYNIAVVVVVVVVVARFKVLTAAPIINFLWDVTPHRCLSDSTNDAASRLC
jgi:hypothetical protein